MFHSVCSFIFMLEIEDMHQLHLWWWNLSTCCLWSFLIYVTAGAEELGNFEQEDKGCMLLHVHAFISGWDCSFGSCYLDVGQVLVIVGIIYNKQNNLVLFRHAGVDWLL